MWWRQEDHCKFEANLTSYETLMCVCLCVYEGIVFFVNYLIILRDNIEKTNACVKTFQMITDLLYFSSSIACV